MTMMFSWFEVIMMTLFYHEIFVTRVYDDDFDTDS